ncbi:MAG: beta-ketoacyl-[acyl-carrier-protein] synthase family protein [Deltaproteobacteria bacterium]|nr:beta-ketoacyl-[acyl-carrier-protein] synthase family protein [Deltaproteobacteria bacterium]
MTAPGAVITGYGAISGFGAGAGCLWQALLQGRSAVAPATAFAGPEYDAHLAAMVPDADPGPRRATALALHAAREALGHAGLEAPFAPELAPRVAVVVGTTLGGILTFLPHLRGGPLPAPPTFAPGGPAVEVACALGAAGPLLVPSLACASGTAAVGLALQLVRDGRADVVVAGGVDALSDFVYAGFQSLTVLDAAPARPFAAERRGLNLGEGAAFLVVEADAHARARGARARARLTGLGLADDARHMTGPDPEGRGAAQAMAAALADAGRTAAEVDFINLHGTGTSFNDLMERHAVWRLLGARTPAVPVDSIKGALGHTLGAAGAFEALLLCRVVAAGLIPPTVNTTVRDPAIDLDVVVGAPRRVPVRVALSTTSGFGGLNAALVVERVTDQEDPA